MDAVVSQLNQWMVDDKSQSSHCWSEYLKTCNGECKSNPCAIVLELWTAVWTHVYTNTDTDS
jgi:hypothetical protein